MDKPSGLTVAERLKGREAITAAVQRAVREAVLAHARAGNPVAGWEDGKVVWLQPDEVFRRLAATEAEPPMGT